ncbi:hypothetical protein GGI11_001630 [Coemansia sp. RSA 2049]|nr:hypothetical protein GGI11_001630 [Coemansia sp. RSA 2049]KAJ2604939.1 hypothetical protein EV177_006271 [Coemansia sp. RSA 1804]
MVEAKDAVLALLSTVGALTGVGLCALGIYELSASLTPEFAYTYVFLCMVVLGLFIAYAFSIGTSGILYSDEEIRFGMLVVVASSIILCELCLVLMVPMDPGSMDIDFEQTWKQKYGWNKGELQWIEHRYGCCGFRNATDMPSSDDCNGTMQLNRADGGCLQYMRGAAQDQNRAAIRGCMVAVVIQVAVLAIGALVYARDPVFSTTWIVEEEEEGQAEGPPLAATTTSAVPAAAVESASNVAAAGGDNASASRDPQVATAAADTGAKGKDSVDDAEVTPTATHIHTKKQPAATTVNPAESTVLPPPPTTAPE